ncbi:hypothetical protein L6V77_25280 [Myxococcota bacterium]|jgi:hypothetical protein|nr:hypothetical protein [Myxococcota bacterium]
MAMEKEKGNTRKGAPKRTKKNPVSVGMLVEYLAPVAVGFGLSKADIHAGWWGRLKPGTKAFICAVCAAVARYFGKPTIYGAFAAKAGGYVGHGKALELIAKVKGKVEATAQTAPAGGPTNKELQGAADKELADIDDDDTNGFDDDTGAEDTNGFDDDTGAGDDVGGDEDDDDVGDPDWPGVDDAA